MHSQFEDRSQLWCNSEEATIASAKGKQETFREGKTLSRPPWRIYSSLLGARSIETKLKRRSQLWRKRNQKALLPSEWPSPFGSSMRCFFLHPGRGEERETHGLIWGTDSRRDHRVYMNFVECLGNWPKKGAPSLHELCRMKDRGNLAGRAKNFLWDWSRASM